MVLIRWHDSLLLECLLKIRDLRSWLTSRLRSRNAALQNLTAATASETYKMLAATDAGRPLSAAGSGVFWTAYAGGALVTIWIVSLFDALGFGFGWIWESSSLGLDFTRAMIEFARATVEFPALVLGWIGSDGLPSVAAAPIVAHDSPEALAARRLWLLVLTAGIGVYLLVPMALMTLFIYVYAHRKMSRWDPPPVPDPRPAATAMGCGSAPDAAPLRPEPAGGEACTHVARLEWHGAAVALPAPLDQLVDLGDADALADLERVRGILSAGRTRLVVLTWLPLSPDAGVEEKLRELATASTIVPLVLLDGVNCLLTDPRSTQNVRRHQWSTAASRIGFIAFECDLAELTDADRRDLARALGYGEASGSGRGPTTESGSGSTRR